MTICLRLLFVLVVRVVERSLQAMAKGARAQASSALR